MKAGGNLLDQSSLEAMVTSALRMIQEIGIETNRPDLLEKAQRLDGLTVRENRIHVAPEVAREVIALNRMKPVLPHPEHPTITVSNRATLIADHHTRELRPITRSDVITGTRLIDALCPRHVTGNSSGTPQDTLPPLQPIEQYLIGYRYSRHGGKTPVPLTPEVEAFLLEIRAIAENDFNPNRRDFPVWIPSPLRLEGNELDKLLDSDAEVASFNVGSMPIMGLTGPVDPTGVMTLSLAETLGGVAILHRIFPDAESGFYPHPEPMDPRTGLMAFGTPEWNRLLLLEKEVREFLDVPVHGKENLTSACMPDGQAQADKMASICFGVANGFTRFNLFPLCADEAWSHVQLVLDVDYVHTAWRTRLGTVDPQRAEDAFRTIAGAVRENQLPGEMEDTVRHLRENYYASPFTRVFSSSQWDAEGKPDPLTGAEEVALELIGSADYSPPDDPLREIVEIYLRACRTFGGTPMQFG